jgi:hypothetical protein
MAAYGKRHRREPAKADLEAASQISSEADIRVTTKRSPLVIDGDRVVVDWQFKHWFVWFPKPDG